MKRQDKNTNNHTNTVNRNVSQDEVSQWVKRDLDAAVYFLSMLQRYPEVVDKLAQEIYLAVKSKEHGQAISQHENP